MREEKTWSKCIHAIKKIKKKKNEKRATKYFFPFIFLISIPCRLANFDFLFALLEIDLAANSCGAKFLFTTPKEEGLLFLFLGYEWLRDSRIFTDAHVIHICILVIFVPRIVAKKQRRSKNVIFPRLSLRLVVVVIWICPGVKYRSLSKGRFSLKPDAALEDKNTKRQERRSSCEKSCYKRIAILPPSSRNPHRRQRNRRDFPYDSEAFDL